jgi:hypothetical protein
VCCPPSRAPNAASDGLALMYWLSCPLPLQRGQTVSVTVTVRERLMDFEVSSPGATCVAGSAAAAVFRSLNSVPPAVLGLDTIVDDALDCRVHKHTHHADCPGSNAVIWCPEYTVLRCNDAAWRRALASDVVIDSSASVLCLGDPLALAPVIYAGQGADVVADYDHTDDESEATLDALWDQSQSHLPRDSQQQMRHLCDMPPEIVFDLIFWDPVEAGGLLRSGCLEQLVASRTKHSRRGCTTAPCCLSLWAQGVTGALLNDMTEVRASEACGFDLSCMNDYSVRSS